MTAPWPHWTRLTVTLLCALAAACAADSSTTLESSSTGLLKTSAATLNGAVGVPYAGGLGVAFSVPNSDPSTQYYWTVTGNMPPGLLVTPPTNTTTSNALILIGTPVQAGEFSVQITVHTSNHTLLISAVPFTIPITGGDTGAPPSVTPSVLTWVIGAPSKQTLTATGGRTPYTSWSTGTALPAWLTLNPATGELSGTPTTTGTFPMTFIVTDSAGRFGTGQVTLTVISLAQFAGTWTGMIAGGPEDGKRLSLLADDRGVVQQGTKGADVIATPTASIQLSANTQTSSSLVLEGWIQLTGILNWHLVCSPTASVDALDCIGHDLDTPANDGTLTLTRINPASQDNVAPTVALSSPASGATGVTTSLMSVEFSEMMSSTGSGAITLTGGTATVNPPPYYLANTSDVNGRTLKIQLNGLQSGTTYTLTLNPAGNAKLRDLAGNALAAKTIAFTTGTVSANRPPTATAATYGVAPNTPLSITLTGTDPEAQALTFAVVTQPTAGTLTGLEPNLTYQSTTAGTVDTFTFTARDPAGNISAPATVTITVLRPPVAVSQQLPVRYDTSLPITLSGTSPDAAAITAYTIVPGSGPTNGSLSGTLAARTYTPSAGFIGTDAFQFTVTDSRGLVSQPGAVTITVTATEPPVATSQAITIVRRQGTDSLSASQWAIPLTGSPGNAVFRIVSWPVHGVLTNFVQGVTYKTSFSNRIISTVTATTSATLNGTTGDITVSPSGSPAWVVFVPNICHVDDFKQDSFTFVAIDANGVASAPATVTLTPTTSTSCVHQF